MRKSTRLRRSDSRPAPSLAAKSEPSRELDVLKVSSSWRVAPKPKAKNGSHVRPSLTKKYRPVTNTEVNVQSLSPKIGLISMVGVARSTESSKPKFGVKRLPTPKPRSSEFEVARSSSVPKIPAVPERYQRLSNSCAEAVCAKTTALKSAKPSKFFFILEISIF